MGESNMWKKIKLNERGTPNISSEIIVTFECGSQIPKVQNPWCSGGSQNNDNEQNYDEIIFRLCLVGRNATALDEVASACKAAASPLVIYVLNKIVFTKWQCWSSVINIWWYLKVVTIAADLAKEEAPAQIVKEAVEKLGGCILWIHF